MLRRQPTVNVLKVTHAHREEEKTTTESKTSQQNKWTIKEEENCEIQRTQLLEEEEESIEEYQYKVYVCTD